MPITYYAQTASEAHWSSFWAQQQLDHLLTVASRDPLSQYLRENLPKSGLILEGGCGLGQYVLFFRQQGYALIGGDFSLASLQAHREIHSPSPLLGLDLLRSPFVDGAFQGHISIGVVEHIEKGPGDMLREFYRFLAPGGVLLISVPWINGYRRLTRPLIQRKQAELQTAGGQFYQYAFTKNELQTFLQEAGFQVQKFYPYSPAKGMRGIPLLNKLYQRIIPGATKATPSPTTTKAFSIPAPQPLTGMRRALYWPPLLALFAHMLLAVAKKPEG
jgi:SAM-dependent methyltransferase